MTEQIVAYDGHQEHWYTGEEIIRCRDCACYSVDDTGECCTLLDFGTEDMADKFCAWGEQKVVE